MCFSISMQFSWTTWEWYVEFMNLLKITIYIFMFCCFLSFGFEYVFSVYSNNFSKSFFWYSCDSLTCYLFHQVVILCKICLCRFELDFQEFCQQVLFECVSKDRPALLQVFIHIYNCICMCSFDWLMISLTNVGQVWAAYP